ncbi:predicted protein [Postia placenta Mad-698-R]|nr:predicted protein [Postia placenta Mad-698-R]
MSLKDSGSWPFEAIKYFSGMFRQLNAAYVVENNSGVAVTLSLFDHVLTFRKELDLVWLQRGPWSIMQLVVVMNRYGGEASMLYLAYMFSGLMPLSTSVSTGPLLSCYCSVSMPYGTTGGLSNMHYISDLWIVGWDGLYFPFSSLKA